MDLAGCGLLGGPWYFFRVSEKNRASVEDYLAGLQDPQARASLDRIRSIIMEEIPEVEEVIRYGIPTYKFHGFVASMAAFKNHCSFFPGHTVNDFAEELKAYKTAKGTIQFPLDKPLPDALVRSMIRARKEENLPDAANR